MKQIFDRSIYLSFDGGKTWEDTELLVNWQYLVPELAKENSCTIDTYDKARSFVMDSLIPNANFDRTIFGNECIELHPALRMHSVRLTRRRFRPFQIKTVFRAIPNQDNLKLSTLVRLLSFSDLVAYMKDRGISLDALYDNISDGK